MFVTLFVSEITGIRLLNRPAMIVGLWTKIQISWSRKATTDWWRHLPNVDKARDASYTVLFPGPLVIFSAFRTAVIINMAVWLSGNALVSIIVVTLRRARLVPGWMTAFGRVNHLGM